MDKVILTFQGVTQTWGLCETLRFIRCIKLNVLSNIDPGWEAPRCHQNTKRPRDMTRAYRIAISILSKGTVTTEPLCFPYLDHAAAQNWGGCRSIRGLVDWGGGSFFCEL